MRRSTSALAVAAALVTVVSLAAPAVAGEPLTRKQFLQAANRVCEQAYESIDAAVDVALEGVAPDEEPSSAQIEDAVAGVVTILDNAADEVDALQGPAKVEKQVAKFLKQFNAVVADFEDDPQAAFEEETTGYPFKKPDNTAKKIGLTDCAQRG
jgi:hypothetical protein